MSGVHLRIPHLKYDRDTKEAFTDLTFIGLACLLLLRPVTVENYEMAQQAELHQRSRNLERQGHHIIYHFNLDSSIQTILRAKGGIINYGRIGGVNGTISGKSNV